MHRLQMQPRATTGPSPLRQVKEPAHGTEESQEVPLTAQEATARVATGLAKATAQTTRSARVARTAPKARSARVATETAALAGAALAGNQH